MQRKLDQNDPTEILGGVSTEGKVPFIISQLRDEDSDFLMKEFVANSQKLGRQGKQDNAKATPTRDIHLSPNQIHPSSTVKRKMKAGNSPQVTYDNAKATPTRDIHLSPKQSHPSSAVKRKMKASNSPEARYDPLEKVDRKKQVALVEYVKTDM
ncbi:unnamed protein product [Microthlaspi erraticum]|uniref:Uncharacterized protein n=1 Tax=Microthlaspi erraticum TaxID=1685480 RepID=A0A6D2IK18_9BRAS|nr:unnamed protein product [Microthlaspi erraticum]